MRESPVQPTGAPLFVHDFVAVPLPVDEATRVFTTISDPALADLVAGSWNRHAGILRSVDPRADVRAVQVSRHGHHFRHDAAIVNLGWTGDGGLPTLDADLELVSFGDMTHLHLMGRYDMPAHIERFTDVGSLVHRVMVMTVRCFLTELGQSLERSR
ncbi:MAG: hypothetical protein AAF480_08735 [Actinomycetota bacterium]